MDFSINSRSPSLVSAHAAEVAGKVVDQRQPLSSTAIGGPLDAQVLIPQPTAVQAMTPQQLNGLLDISGVSESESQAMMALFLATLVHQEKEEGEGGLKDQVAALLSFDPGAWEKHIGVLVASIVALNVARKASAEMSGTFVQMAYEAAIAQGVAIMAGGEAAMWAAVSGAVVAATMSATGAALTLRGQSQKHTDIKTNQTNAVTLEAKAQKMRAELELDPSKRADLEPKIREVVTQAMEARLQSALQAKTYERNLTVGGAINAMAMTISSGLSAILRLQEYSERQREVLHQSEQGLNKAVSDVANQSTNEYTALLSKILDAIQQLVDSRGSTLNSFASARA
ncbi:IpaC/SipC family type III secretion system effector [Pseudomonas putida]|uniref:IpaC/SipC family type III secretion system effector n=1 Tax=Pseudomonas putida TaxID=303 RepID=UPI000A118C8C|nr:IpaC/SipC family type III secretion system effector [Pseudomonas putida]ORL48467.1 hypothetical protein B7H18_27540 [Pseudomonas putida]